MHEPSVVVHRGDRDAQGGLLPEHLQEICRTLQDRGFVLLPSDTSYSIAAWLRSERTRDDINMMLQRPDEPISLAFPSVEAVQRWTANNGVADRLLECFTPGPITVVRPASRLIPTELLNKAFRSQNRTIGVRIPNSVEERQVAGATQNPVTTVAVRNLTTAAPVTSFADAVEIVRAGIGTIGGAAWCAIEGEIQYQGHSTVVEVLGGRGYRLVRRGSISEEEVRDCIAQWYGNAARDSMIILVEAVPSAYRTAMIAQQSGIHNRSSQGDWPSTSDNSEGHYPGLDLLDRKDSL